MHSFKRRAKPTSLPPTVTVTMSSFLTHGTWSRRTDEVEAPPQARCRKSESATSNAVLFASWIGYASENRPHPTSRYGNDRLGDPAPAPVAYESPRAEYE